MFCCVSSIVGLIEAVIEMGQRNRKVKIISFIPASLVLQYDQLARKYGISRSELYRLAIHRAFRSVSIWCEQTHSLIESSGQSADVEVGARPVAAQLAGRSVPGGGSDGSPLAALQGFCQTLLAQEPEISDDQFATMAKAQATVLGLSAVQAEPVIEALVAEMFPALASDGPLDSDDEAGESSVDLD